MLGSSSFISFNFLAAISEVSYDKFKASSRNSNPNTLVFDFGSLSFSLNLSIADILSNLSIFGLLKKENQDAAYSSSVA